MKPSRAEDLIGKQFEYFTVIARGENKTNSAGRSIKSYWKCKCICGIEKDVRGEHLRSGVTKSCGCRKTSEHKLKRIFDSKYVISKKGCWEWTGYCDKDGYPKIGDKCLGAHRYSYERFKGKIPEGMLVCHSCDNPSCVNPEHLWLGSHNDNAQDKVQKKRQAIGEKIGNAKLTEYEVKEIRKLSEEGMTQNEIGKKFNISQAVISKIVLKEAWKHVQ